MNSEKGYKYIAGVDEVGRGTLAGPVVAAAVILSKNIVLDGLNDSKKVSKKNREKLFDEICSSSISWSVAYCDAKEIDSINILQATMLAMRRSILGLNQVPCYIKIDGNALPDLRFKDNKILAESIIGGDRKVPEISAASILAKVYRDRLMINLDGVYKGYYFSEHKGYGTKRHFNSIKELGPSPQHRLSFKPFCDKRL